MTEPTPTLEDLQATVTALNARLTKGSDVLFAREQAGQMDATYRSWLATWLDLLADYEVTEPLLIEAARPHTSNQQPEAEQGALI